MTKYKEKIPPRIQGIVDQMKISKARRIKRLLGIKPRSSLSLSDIDSKSFQNTAKQVIKEYSDLIDRLKDA